MPDNGVRDIVTALDARCQIASSVATGGLQIGCRFLDRLERATAAALAAGTGPHTAYL
jgi:hypothetical protein